MAFQHLRLRSVFRVEAVQRVEHQVGMQPRGQRCRGDRVRDSEVCVGYEANDLGGMTSTGDVRQGVFYADRHQHRQIQPFEH